MYFSSMTLREELAATGTIDRDRLEAMIDQVEANESIKDALIHINEAKGCYPDEDFMDVPIYDLGVIWQASKGAKRTQLGEVIKSLKHLQENIIQTGEYGADELNQAIEELTNGDTE